jgi:hypothetical protein
VEAHLDASSRLFPSLSDHRASRFLQKKRRLSQTAKTRAHPQDLRNGTAPRAGDRDGITASVTDIISSTDAIDPRLRAPLAIVLTRLVVSSPRRRLVPVLSEAAAVNASKESRVIALSDPRPGSLVFRRVYTSTNTITNTPVPIRVPPSGHSRLLIRMSPRRIGWNANSVAKRRKSQICSNPPVCERVRPKT